MPVRLRLHVNVAGPRFDRLREDLVDQPHDRGLLGHLRSFGSVQLDILQHLDAASSRWAIRPSIVSAPTPRCVLISLASSSGNANTGVTLCASRGTDTVDRIEIERISRRHHQRRSLATDRKNFVPMDQFDGEIIEQRQIDVGC